MLLQSDGKVVAFGRNRNGQCCVPDLEDGVSCSQLSAGHGHTVLLLSDGSALAFGWDDEGQCRFPDFQDGVAYAQVSAGGGHTVLLKEDGRAVACGRNEDGQCRIPDLKDGVAYTQVSAGGGHTVLLKSDGLAVACGSNQCGQCRVPDLPYGVIYTQVSAGGDHTVLLRSDGRAVLSTHNPRRGPRLANVIGWDDEDQSRIPDLPDGITYVQVSAGCSHTVLLRSDGYCVACGSNGYGQCDIPGLPIGVTYTHIFAGGFHTLLLRNDGTAVACGRNDDGQCRIPDLEDRAIYMSHVVSFLTVLQLFCEDTGDGHICMTCVALNGEVVSKLILPEQASISLAQDKIAKDTGIAQTYLRLALPSENLLNSLPASTHVKDLQNLKAF